MIRHRLLIHSVVAAAVLKVVIGAPPLANANGLMCETLFAPRALPPLHSTVKIIGTSRNQRGEEFYILRRHPGQYSWGSLYSPHPYDRQGNPLSNFAILGMDLATVLGFGETPRMEMLAPTVDTINARIAEFNQFLVRHGIAPIPLTYYVQQRPTIVSYLTGWSDTTSEPVAHGLTNHTVHDISFHYTNGLLPVKVARLLYIQSSIANKWLSFHNLGSSSLASRMIAGELDRLSTSANFQPGKISEVGLAKQFAEHFQIHVTGDAAMAPFVTSEFAALMKDYFENTSPLQAFIAKVKRFEPHLATDSFFAEIRRAYPEMNLSLAELGLRDTKTIHDLYQERADELRWAAGAFLEEKARRK